MAKITDLIAVDAITGDEYLPIVQGGATKRATMTALRALIVPFLQYWYRGDKGDPGAAGNVAATLGQLKAAAITNATMIASYDGGATMTWTPGDFTARAADRPGDYVQADGIALTVGAWVRQTARGIQYLPDYVGAKPRRHADKSGEVVSVLDFGAKGDGVTDDTAAFNAAIATDKTVIVPYTPLGYSVTNIGVVSNMHIVGEKVGIAGGPMLHVRTSGTAAFYNATGDNVFHCTFENLACAPAAGVTNASFYGQSTQTKYAAYFTFRNIETYLGLRVSYRGLFIFALWDRIRDGYSGSATDIEHSCIVALAESYNQINQQNVNAIRDSMIFSAFGGQASITASYGLLWTILNTDFEFLKTRAFRGYNVMQVRFSNCWFERIAAPSIVDALCYPGTAAASSVLLDHCNGVLNEAPVFATVETPGTIALRDSLFRFLRPGDVFCTDGARVTVNSHNIALDTTGALMPAFFAGTHQDTFHEGRRMLNGAADNAIPGMTLQNLGGVTASAGFLSDDNIAVGTDFVTIARSATGLGGTVAISGYDPGNDGLQFRVVKDWHSGVVRDVAPLLSNSPKLFSFRATDGGLQMKVDAGSVIVFTTLLN